MAESLTCPHPDCRKPLPLPAAEQPYHFLCPCCGKLIQVQPAQVPAVNLDLPEDHPAVTLDLPVLPPQRNNGPPAVTLDLPSAGTPGPDLLADASPQTLAPDPLTRQPPPAPPGARSPRLPVDAPSSIGRYQILDFLGEGGFGRVYLAHDTRLDRRVALKVSRPDRRSDSKRMQRFLDEARAAARFRHPNIVQVFDSGEYREKQADPEETHYYIASAYIEGQSLDKRLRELPPGHTLDFRTTVQLVRKVAEALAYAHRQKIVHRDVKPANIMLDEQGEPLLMDFGLAAPHEEGQAAKPKQKASGTPPYMPLEQFDGVVVPASDQYSLGCTLYELLAGRLPFAASSWDHYRLLHENEPVPRLRTVNPRVPRDLEAICLKCLEKDPKRRYATCQELGDDLRRFLDGEPVKARLLAMRERMVKWGRREPRLAGAILAAVGLLVTTVVVLAVSDASQRWLNERLKEIVGKLNTETQAKTEALEQFKMEQQEKEKQQEEKVRQYRTTLYVNDLRRALPMIEQNDITGARGVLDSLPWDLRGWEWGFADNWCERRCRSFKGHSDYVMSISFSPDGKSLASASFDETVKLWDTQTGQEILSLKGHSGRVVSVSFSPDGKRLASATSGGVGVKVWNVQTGQELLSIKGHTSVAFSPDGKRLASGSENKTVTVWNAQTGQEELLLKGHSGIVTCVSFSPDGKRLASAGEGKMVKVWDAQTGQEDLSLKGHTGEVTSVAFSPDGKRIATASIDQTVKVWDAQTGQEALSLKGHSNKVTSVAFSPDGKRIAAASGARFSAGEVKVWDAQTGQEAFSLRGHADVVTSVSFSPDGKRLASASEDWTVKVWDAQTGPEVLSLKGHADEVTSVAFSPDGKQIATASDDKTVKVWDARTGQETASLKGYSGRVTSVCFSPDGKRIASASAVWDDKQNRYIEGEVKVWDVQTGQEALSLRATQAGSPVSASIPTANESPVPAVWDDKQKRRSGRGEGLGWRSGQETFSFKAPSNGFTSVGFSPDGNRIASGDSAWDQKQKLRSGRGEGLGYADRPGSPLPQGALRYRHQRSIQPRWQTHRQRQRSL